MRRVFGLETEYGITVDGMADVDVVRESIAIVRSYTEHLPTVAAAPAVTQP